MDLETTDQRGATAYGYAFVEITNKRLKSCATSVRYAFELDEEQRRFRSEEGVEPIHYESFDFVYARDGIKLDRMDAKNGFIFGTCDWVPDLVIAPWPLKPGKQATQRSECVPPRLPDTPGSPTPLRATAPPQPFIDEWEVQVADPYADIQLQAALPFRTVAHELRFTQRGELLFILFWRFSIATTTGEFALWYDRRQHPRSYTPPLAVTMIKTLCRTIRTDSGSHCGP